jgi:type VI secretion system secreted protein Hcp
MAGEQRQPSPFLQLTRRGLLKAGTVATAALGVSALDAPGLGAAPVAAQALPLGQPAELTFYATVAGQKQGKFATEIVDRTGTGKLAGLAYFHEIKSPRDTASGQATGRRTHNPVRFVKEWGASSPQFLTAFVGGETLTTVLFEFLRPADGGAQEVYFTALLTNAFVIAIDQHAEGGIELEEIALGYQKIAWTHKPTGTTAEDNSQGGTK